MAPFPGRGILDSVKKAGRASKGPCVSSASALGRGKGATDMNLEYLLRVMDIQVVSLVCCCFNIPFLKEVVSLF